MSKRPAATTIGRTSPVKHGGSTASAHLQGGWDGLIGRAWCHNARGGNGDRCAPCIRLRHMRGRGAGTRDVNRVARDSPGLVNQGVGALTPDLAARVAPKEVNGEGGAATAAASRFGRSRRYPLRQLPRAERANRFEARPGVAGMGELSPRARVNIAGEFVFHFKTTTHTQHTGLVRDPRKRSSKTRRDAEMGLGSGRRRERHGASSGEGR